jgi:hypothetical protein
VSDWYEGLASEDFSRARTKEFLSRISLLLDPSRDRLLSLDEVKKVLKPGGEVYKGIQAVPLELIVGSEGRYRDFNRHFLPRHDYLKTRWVRVDLAHYAEVPLPPVRLYEIGGVYFVRDGNHRVSVAKMRGQYSLDAEVSSLDAEAKLRPGMTMEELKREIVDYEKREFYEKTEFGKLTGDDHLEFSSAGRYEEILEHILVHKYFVNQGRSDEIPLDAAIYSWYENVYRPIIGAIEELGLLARFPGRTASDLYVYIVKYWGELKEKYGLGVPLEDAAKGFNAKYGTSGYARLRLRLSAWARALRTLFGRPPARTGSEAATAAETAEAAAAPREAVDGENEKKRGGL